MCGHPWVKSRMDSNTNCSHKYDGHLCNNVLQLLGSCVAVDDKVSETALLRGMSTTHLSLELASLEGHLLPGSSQFSGCSLTLPLVRTQACT